MRRPGSISAFAILVGFACVSGGPGGPDAVPLDVVLDWQLVVNGLSDPVFLTAPANDDRLFVVEQGGRVRVVDPGGQLVSALFLNLSQVVANGSEQGLLGMAFHPDYGSNGFVFVSYTDLQGNSQVVRYTVSPDPNLLDVSSARTILSVDQPFSNHNGGMIAFGPDGNLYVGLGDGGGGDDPLDSGQDIGTLLGTILRLDVDPCAGAPCAGGAAYVVPADNPFVGGAGRDEIWAYGLRNPWRFSFDVAGGTLHIGDVGQNAFEEINAVTWMTPGVNYGWRLMEGPACRPGTNCDPDGLALPVASYPNPSDGCAVVGGYVYRGNAIPDIVGHYFYSDFCSGWLRSFSLDGVRATNEIEWDIAVVGSVTSFGEGADAELYITSGSSVYRLVEAG